MVAPAWSPGLSVDGLYPDGDYPPGTSLIFSGLTSKEPLVEVTTVAALM